MDGPMNGHFIPQEERQVCITMLESQARELHDWTGGLIIDMQLDPKQEPVHQVLKRIHDVLDELL
jgi:hypothetical protein